MTKCNDGGLKSLKKECKIVWVYPSKNPNRCPVRLVDKYVSLEVSISQKSSVGNNVMACSCKNKEHKFERNI